jgi:hypothetical protein
MVTEPNYDYYTRMAQHELNMAAASTEKSIKAAHLNMAAEYATLGEKSINRDHGLHKPSE